MKRTLLALGLGLSAALALASCTKKVSRGPVAPRKASEIVATPSAAPLPGTPEEEEEELAAAAGITPEQMTEGKIFVNGWDGLNDQIPTETQWAIEHRVSDATPPPVGPTPTTAPTKDVTYSSDVAALLEANCVSCHKAGGRRSSSPMTDYDSAKALGASIVARVEAGTMPPSGSLSSDVKAKLAKWKAAGFPEGTAEEPVDDRVVFRIKKGTGNGPWNAKDGEAVLKVGKKFVIYNDDTVTHQWHTNGSPCPHGNPIPPGGSDECVPAQAFSDGPLYDHITDGRFYVRAE